MAKIKFKEYGWRKGGHFKKEWAPVFGDRVDWLEQRIGRAPKSQDVLSDAEHPRSPIHGMFEWDDSAAAHKYRVTQASSLLSSLTVKVEYVKEGKRREVDVPVRVTFSDESRKSGRSHYDFRKVIQNPIQRFAFLERAADQLQTTRRQYDFLEELSGVFKEIDKVHEKVIPKMRKKISDRVPVKVA